MKNRKITACIILAAMLLTACNKNIDGEQYITEDIFITESSTSATAIASDTTEIDIVFPAEETTVTETIETEEETLTKDAENLTENLSEIEKYFYEQGLGNYNEDSKSLRMDLSNLNNEDTYILSREYSSEEENPYFAEVEQIEIKNYVDIDWSFIGQFRNLRKLNIYGDDVNVNGLGGYVSDLPLEWLYVESGTYDEDDAKQLMSLLPDCLIKFTCYYHSEQSDPWDDYFSSSKPIDGFFFFTQPSLRLEENSAAEWECRTLEVTEDYYNPWDVWSFESYLVCAFTNYTRESRTVDSVRILKGINGKETIPFLDGSDSLEIGLEIPARTHRDYIITDEMLDYSAMKSGLYRVEFVCGVETLNQMFLLAKGNPTEEEAAEGRNYPEVIFLTDEQREVFYKANSYMTDYFGCSGNLSPEEAKSLTVEEFVNRFCDAFTYDYAYEKCLNRYINKNGKLTASAGDRGSNIGQHDEYFLPVYADDEDVIFQIVSIHAHSDVPYGIGFETMNYHMLKTEDGWRFDNFRIWY